MTYTERKPWGRMVIHAGARKDSNEWLGNITIMRTENIKSLITRESYPVGPPQSTEAEALACAEMAGSIFLEEARRKDGQQV